jgi:aspartate carbamoyltransferase catalytic subunit
MQHLLDIASLNKHVIERILQSALSVSDSPQTAGNLEGRLVMNLFYEPSTRTRVSFEVAAKRLGMHVINIAAGGSSVVKGETLMDTFQTLQAMSPDVIIIRHPDNGSVAGLAKLAPAGLSGDLDSLRILIAGDLNHSRVAKSNITMLKKLGAGEIRLAAPEMLMPNPEMREGTHCFDNLDQALQGADVVMMLRIQHERLRGLDLPGDEDYHLDWGLTAGRLQRAAPNCRVMHPGPMNRGVEIASDVAYGPQSLILQQVRNGVYARMAILLDLLS